MSHRVTPPPQSLFSLSLSDPANWRPTVTLCVVDPVHVFFGAICIEFRNHPRSRFDYRQHQLLVCVGLHLHAPLPAASSSSQSTPNAAINFARISVAAPLVLVAAACACIAALPHYQFMSPAAAASRAGCVAAATAGHKHPASLVSSRHQAQACRWHKLSPDRLHASVCLCVHASCCLRANTVGRHTK